MYDDYNRARYWELEANKRNLKRDRSRSRFDVFFYLGAALFFSMSDCYKAEFRDYRNEVVIPVVRQLEDENIHASTRKVLLRQLDNATQNTPPERIFDKPRHPLSTYLISGFFGLASLSAMRRSRKYTRRIKQIDEEQYELNLKNPAVSVRQLLVIYPKNPDGDIESYEKPITPDDEAVN